MTFHDFIRKLVKKKTPTIIKHPLERDGFSLANDGKSLWSELVRAAKSKNKKTCVVYKSEQAWLDLLRAVTL